MRSLTVFLAFSVLAVIIGWYLDSKEKDYWIEYYKNKADSNYKIYLKCYKMYCRTFKRKKK